MAQHKGANNKSREIPSDYYIRLDVCDKEFNCPHHIGKSSQPDWLVYDRGSEDCDAWLHKLLRISQRIYIRIWERITALTLYRGEKELDEYYSKDLTREVLESLKSNRIRKGKWRKRVLIREGWQQYYGRTPIVDIN